MNEIDCFGGFVAFVLGWLLAQLGKLIGDIITKRERLSFVEIMDCLTRSGGMPSGHTASFLGMTTYLGIKLGLRSGVFVLAACMLAIVIYDAVNVRYAVGEQGELINHLAAESAHSETRKRQLKIVRGHTILQVLVGGVLGLIIGIITGVTL